MKRALVLASVASMIEQFNMPNIRLLQEMGYKVHVACNFEVGNNISDHRIRSFQKELGEMHVHYHQIPIPRNLKDIDGIVRSYRNLCHLMYAYKFDLVHCQSPIGGVVARLACRKERRKGTRVIYTAHGFHFYKGAPLMNWLLYYPVERWMVHYTDILLTINKEDEVRAKGFAGEKVRYIPGVGIDARGIGRQAPDEDVRRRLEIPNDAVLLVSVGELNANKNHEIVLRALSNLKMDNLYYIICGQGALDSHLHGLCRELGIEGQVRMPGFLEDVISVLKASDIYVFPSKREGLSVALMEAMAAGLPVVCSQIRGNTDLIQEGHNGYLVGSMEQARYEEAIRRLYQDEALRQGMGRKNLERIKAYDIAHVNECMREIYKEPVRGEGKRR